MNYNIIEYIKSCKLVNNRVEITGKAILYLKGEIYC